MDVVAPRGTFNLESFAEMARKAIDERKWGTAMWAARLSVAVEDVTTGECLTNDILHCDQISDRLRRIRNRPEQRDREFGPRSRSRSGSNATRKNISSGSVEEIIPELVRIGPSCHRSAAT